jgi:hypothetical protein
MPGMGQNTLFIVRGWFGRYHVYERTITRTARNWLATFRRLKDAEAFVEKHGVMIYEYSNRQEQKA